MRSFSIIMIVLNGLLALGTVAVSRQFYAGVAYPWSYRYLFYWFMFAALPLVPVLAIAGLQFAVQRKSSLKALMWIYVVGWTLLAILTVVTSNSRP